MSWNYSGDPAASQKDEVRFLSGDTEETDQLVQDEEILWVITKQGTSELSAAVVCESLAAKFARLADTKVGGVDEKLSQKSKQFRERAEELRSQTATLASISVGGLTHSGKRTLDTDSDAVQPSFRIGGDDNPRGPDERHRVLRNGVWCWN